MKHEAPPYGTQGSGRGIVNCSSLASLGCRSGGYHGRAKARRDRIDEERRARICPRVSGSTRAGNYRHAEGRGHAEKQPDAMKEILRIKPIAGSADRRRRPPPFCGSAVRPKLRL